MKDNPLFKNFQETRLALSFDRYTFIDELFSDLTQIELLNGKLYFSIIHRITHLKH